MPNTYSVVHGDVAAEAPALFPGGFDAVSVPTATRVTEQIATADVIVSERVERITGVSPALGDKAAPIAKNYILNWVLAWLMRVIYAGEDPERIDRVVAPYEAEAEQSLKELDLLATAAAGAGTDVGFLRTRAPVPSADRELLITNEMLDGGARGGTRPF